MDDRDGAGIQGNGRSGGRGRIAEEKIRRIDDPHDAGPRGDAGAGDRHAREQPGGAGQGHGGAASCGGHAADGNGGDASVGRPEDTAGDDLEDAAIGDGKHRGPRRPEADGDRRADVERRAREAGDIGDVLTIEDARDGITRDRGDGDDVRAHAGGETGDTRAIRDGGGRAQRANQAGEEVVASGRRDAVDRRLGARGEHETKRTAQTLGNRSEIEDDILGTQSAIDLNQRVAVGGKDQPGHGLADRAGRVTEEHDGAATQFQQAQGIETIRVKRAGEGLGVIKNGESGLKTIGDRTLHFKGAHESQGAATVLQDPPEYPSLHASIDDQFGFTGSEIEAFVDLESSLSLPQDKRGPVARSDDSRGLRTRPDMGVDRDVATQGQPAFAAQQNERLRVDVRVRGVEESKRPDGLL